MRTRIAVLLLVSALVAAACTSSGDDRADDSVDGEPEVAGESVARVNVGAASTSVLPLVDGGQAYLEGLPGPDDATSLGNFVQEWDAGRVAVGNGAPEAHWVRDDVRAKALAIEDPDTGAIQVIATNDLYMVFRPDIDALRDLVAERLPADVVDRVQVQVASSHNHHGPDTAFQVNHAWYDSALDRWADAVVDAVTSVEPATLTTASGEHYFGVTSTRDPQVIDPVLNVLQAVGDDGAVIATLVNWSNHPEVTLNWEIAAPDADCEALGEQAGCSAENAYYTADYPGHMSRVIEDTVGGEALFANGAIGALLTPLGAPVWEVDDEHPVGDGYTVPDGADLPGDAQTPVDQNFRRAAVIGEQLGLAALDLIDSEGVVLDDATMHFDSEVFYTRVSNIGFRVLGVVDENTGYSGLGHEPIVLYTCEGDEPNEETCTDTGSETETDEDLDLEVRSGEFIQTEVGKLEIGPIGMVFIPGEIQSTLTMGLPADFREDPGRYYLEPEAHAFGDDFAIPGYVRNQVDDEYVWMIGLGNDQLGYIVPISDYWMTCTADIELIGGAPGTCEDLHDAGELPLPDAIPGAECHAAAADDSYLADNYNEEAAAAIAEGCRYGQGIGNQLGIHPEDHYEETNSAGWDLAQDVFDALERLTGASDDTQVNPDFGGYSPTNPPPTA
ncbi:MAG: hypothetical protein R3A49_01005 [Acidimicrobiia bacterium]